MNLKASTIDQPKIDQIQSLLTPMIGHAESRKIIQNGLSLKSPRMQGGYFKALADDLAKPLPDLTVPFTRFKEFINLRTTPVSVKKFVEHPLYLNLKGQVWPEILKAVYEICHGNYISAICTGGIGSGKTTVSILVQLYQLYLLACYHNPQANYGLQDSSEIVIVFQSMRASIAKTVNYNRFRSIVEKSPFFDQYFPFRKDIKSQLLFPNNIIVKGVSGEDTAVIGENVIGGIIEEVNHMPVITKSKKTIDGATYDQAWAISNSIEKRRKSRFTLAGLIRGMLNYVGSRRYDGQFTDVKEKERQAEIDEKGESQIYLYDKREWEIKPKPHQGPWFFLFVGDQFTQPKIFKKKPGPDDYPADRVRKIPEYYWSDFRTDLLGSVRDIAGYSTRAINPFLINIDAVFKCFKRDRQSIFSRDTVDFAVEKLKILKKNLINPQALRLVHFDLALTMDAAGMGMGHVPLFERRNGEYWPTVAIDAMLQIRPPGEGEIDLATIRKILYICRDDEALKIPIKWATCDEFQSRDFRQQLYKKGFKVGRQSVDKTIDPYWLLKNMFYLGLITLPEHEILKNELKALEWDLKKDKVIHPETGSKDVADALAALVFGLYNRREIWNFHKIPIRNVLQDSLRKDASIPPEDAVQ